MSSTDVEVEHDDHIRRYRLCQAGFVLIAVGMLLRAIDVGLHLGVFFTPRWFIALQNLFAGRFYAWAIRAPLVVSMIGGPYLLWARWSHPKWMRGTGLLVAVGLIDLVLWGFDCHQFLGIGGDDPGHQWLRLHVARAVSWVQVTFGAALVAEFLDHLGRHGEARACQKVRGFVVTGVAIWILYFLVQTSWDGGWPLMQRGLTPTSMLLLMAYLLLLTVASIQLMAVSILSAHESLTLAEELRRHQHDHDTGLLRSRSETHDDFPDSHG